MSKLLWGLVWVTMGTVGFAVASVKIELQKQPPLVQEATIAPTPGKPVHKITGSPEERIARYDKIVADTKAKIRVEGDPYFMNDRGDVGSVVFTVRNDSDLVVRNVSMWCTYKQQYETRVDGTPVYKDILMNKLTYAGMIKPHSVQQIELPYRIRMKHFYRDVAFDPTCDFDFRINHIDAVRGEL